MSIVEEEVTKIVGQAGISYLPKTVSLCQEEESASRELTEALTSPCA